MTTNQCDGCMSGLPLVGGTHVDSNGTPVMVCQRSRYTESEKKFNKETIHDSKRADGKTRLV